MVTYGTNAMVYEWLLMILAQRIVIAENSKLSSSTLGSLQVTDSKH